MIPAELCAPQVAAARLARWWIASAGGAEASAFAGATIEVREDVLFAPNMWLSLGSVGLRLPVMGGTGATQDEAWSPEEHLLSALLKGGYEWTVPDGASLEAELLTSLGRKSNDKTPTVSSRVRDAIGYSMLRLGLETPLLDAHDLAGLPFTRPVTLVADTNAVLQGGIDFSVRFLYPMARLHIPEPVHAELNNQAASYFASRRSVKVDANINARLSALRQRLTSQGGLRTLLRLQLQSGVEIERLQVEAEEPRHFDITGETKDKGGDRSAVPDRMVLETALRHRALIASGHPVRIMTSDQGLARSALIEGIDPLYFPPRPWKALFGRTYRGAVIAPLLSVGGSIWHRVPLTEVLWELAVCFGCARLRLSSGATFTVTATRTDLVWSTFHARTDLLWIESSSPGDGVDSAKPRPLIPRTTVDAAEESSRLVAPKFSADKMLRLWSWMSTHRRGTLGQAAKALEVSDKTARDYVRLMASGGFVRTQDGSIVVDGESFDPLWTSIRASDWDTAREQFSRLPAFAALCGELAARRVVASHELRTIPEATLPGFQRLGEICGAILNVPEAGLCFCRPRPTLDNFCRKALEAYAEAIAADSSARPLVHSGAWMETLALAHQVHPLFAPTLLQEAITGRKLDVIFEGSQPFREKSDHLFRRLVWRRDEPWLEDVPLYRGDYLATDRASVHLRIEGANP